MKAREATLADKVATIELWKRCALTRPCNDPSRDFDFAHSGPASAEAWRRNKGIAPYALAACRTYRIIDAPGMLAELIRWLGGLDEQFPAV